MDRIVDNSKLPVVGILVPESTILNMRKQRKQDRIQRYYEASKEAGVKLYFFSARGVNFDRRRINGVHFDETYGLWRRKVFNLPDVLYNRAGCGGDIIELIKKTGIWTLNPWKFNKWLVYTELLKHANIREHLPDTLLFTGDRDLAGMLEKHREVYLKACQGRKGKEVMHTKLLSDGTYQYRYYNVYTDQIIVRQESTYPQLLAGVKAFFGEKPFIIQQAIDVLRVNNSPVDLRAEVQRNGKGEIDIVAVLARVGRPNSPITTHADSYQFGRFLVDVLNYPPYRARQVTAEVEGLIRRVYPAIEESFGNYGEIGIDLALDKQEKLWFIECNSQSAKVSLFKACKEETLQRSFANLMEYSKYLYNQRTEKRSS